MSNAPRSILLLAFPDVQLLDVCGPLQVFASANEIAEQRGLDTPYVCRVVSADGGLVTSASGLALQADPIRAVKRPVHTLIIPGGRGVIAATADQRLTRWTQRQATRATRVASVCSGAFLLAEAGLLDGRRVVTHWARCDELASRYPRLRVETDPIFVRDGTVWTSAGVTAGIDLALALIEEDLGRSLALEVARELVVFVKRPGGQSQFSAMLSLQKADDRFGELHAWMSAHLASDLSVPMLAKRLHMSERSFMRHYKAETGRTPARAVEQLRVEAAQRLLGETAWSVKRIATRCGFGSEETMRRSFVRQLRVAPQTYRERFSFS
ncbi:GlxA family transcriptional regulator [Paraburkholderia rhizosphaerae]|uniref:AraC family transcriptional regulator with amidase-like domain n=1 Tax=Paraburkholderia rhizosphaerae TaxID=480658 RepID=A0A4R8LJ62_9BURK|nr:GlxA family transcriptional regulator [Paraburkholderia rhizosphaerae]TDY43812.1 AraC family transcriptional regulator with amidase-like domain [Paraburkholderia rhizosphaerae]